ncbi:MAG TPA: hypothetical protein DCY88_13750 [Cyanobacteria bacterium UBA11372]|nr:hypothetical protein [Cyanobacteria bacterium UBA11372]
MKLTILSLTALLSFGIAGSAMAQIPNSSLNSFQRHQPDFFEQGGQQFEREIQIQIQPQPIASEDILVIRDIAPMPRDFNPFVAEDPSTSPNQTARTDREQVPANIEPNIVDCK